jgi:hypothetical protein
MLCTPLVIVLLLMRHWFVAHNYFQLSIQLLAGVATYGLGVAWAIWTHRAWKVGAVHDVEALSDKDKANEVAVGLIEAMQGENEA